MISAAADVVLDTPTQFRAPKCHPTPSECHRYGKKPTQAASPSRRSGLDPESKGAGLREYLGHVNPAWALASMNSDPASLSNQPGDQSSAYVTGGAGYLDRVGSGRVLLWRDCVGTTRRYTEFQTGARWREHAQPVGLWSETDIPWRKELRGGPSWTAETACTAISHTCGR